MLRVATGLLVVSLTATLAAGVSARSGSPGETPTRAAAPDQPQPLNHWAYDAMTQIAQSGFVTGFPDNHFSGKRAVLRSQFAAALVEVMQDTGWIVEQGPDSRLYRSIAAVERLAGEFEGELHQLGLVPTELHRRVLAFRALSADPRPRGVEMPVPLGRPGGSQAVPHLEAEKEGLRLAEAEWKRGELVLYSTKPLSSSFPEVGDPLPVRHYPEALDQPHGEQRIAAHNRTVWKWLREGRRPAGARLAWLSQVVNLKEGWRRRGKTQRVGHPYATEVVSTDGRFCFTFPYPYGLIPFCLAGTLPLPRMGPRALPTVFHRTLQLGLEKDVQIALGPKESGILFIRSTIQFDQKRRQARLRAVDVRTGWLLNVAAD